VKRQASLLTALIAPILYGYVPGIKVKLDEVTKILGLAGKPEGIVGTGWRKWFGVGRLKRWRARSQ
jgi:hypothetical protein